VLERGRYILGEQTEAFEEEFAKYVGCMAGVGVASGTDALVLALRACGVGAGDEVITVPHTAVATVAAIELCGAKPVLVDVDQESLCIDVACLERALTARTKAVIPVHIYGCPAALDGICSTARRAGVVVIEDCAQAHGARLNGRRVGSYGDMSCFSFYPTKNLGALGDGGMILTNSSELASRARLLREYGWVERYVSVIGGYNSRLDEIQAAVLRVKLQYLDEDNERRRRLAAAYVEGLRALHVTLPTIGEGAEHSFHQFVIRTSHRDELQAHLKERGIGSLVHYPVPVHLQPAYSRRLGSEGTFPVAERAAREVLSLPMYPELDAGQVAEVCEAVGDFESSTLGVSRGLYVHHKS
jgi:dTDP-4-amino-4,6-dideoxygalactose transaminase